MAEQFSEYADFNKQQRSWIENAAAEYHAWHRGTQLPLYSGLLRAIRNDINTGETLKKERVEDWAQQIDELVAVATRCHPLNQSADFLGALTDRQVVQIGHTIRKKTGEIKEEDSKERFDNIVKLGRRIGLKFNRQQQLVIQAALARESSLHQQKRDLWMDWTEEFLSRLERRKAVDFGSPIQDHIGHLWQLAEDAYPDESRYNRVLWLDSIHKIFVLQTARQREEFSGWLNDIANVMGFLSRKTVRASSLNKREAPGCVT